jgi:hypothetical protein
VLVPLVPLNNITLKQSKADTYMQVHSDPDVFSVPVSAPKYEPDKAFDADTTLSVAYWHIGSSQENVNMEEFIVEKAGFSFRCLRNHVEIEPYTPLQVFKAAVEKPRVTKHRLTGASIVADSKKLKLSGKQPAPSEGKNE